MDQKIESNENVAYGDNIISQDNKQQQQLHDTQQPCQMHNTNDAPEEANREQGEIFNDDHSTQQLQQLCQTHNTNDTLEEANREQGEDSNDDHSSDDGICPHEESCLRETQKIFVDCKRSFQKPLPEPLSEPPPKKQEKDNDAK